MDEEAERKILKLEIELEMVTNDRDQWKQAAERLRDRIIELEAKLGEGGK
jgi:predicted  nucleic acid-binding Zn-ribbon protein